MLFNWQFFFPFAARKEPDPPALPAPEVKIDGVDPISVMAQVMYEFSMGQDAYPMDDTTREHYMQLARALWPLANSLVMDEFLKTVDNETLGVAKHDNIAPILHKNYSAIEGNRIRLNMILHAYAKKHGFILNTPLIKRKPKGKKTNV